MKRLPNLSYRRVLRALRRDGWVVLRQRGSHIRLRKDGPDGPAFLVVPAHIPVKRTTLAAILKQAELTTEQFIDLL